MMTPLEISLCVVIAVLVVGAIVQEVLHRREMRDMEAVADMWQTAAQRYHAQLIEARRCAESVSDALTTPQHMSAASANSMWRDVLGFRAPWESP